MGYMFFHQSAAINFAAHTVHPTVPDRTLAVSTHAPKAKNRFTSKQAQAKLTGGLYAFRQSIPINFGADPVHPTVPNSTLTGPSNETGKINSPSKQACLSALPACTSCKSVDCSMR